MSQHSEEALAFPRGVRPRPQRGAEQPFVPVERALHLPALPVLPPVEPPTSRIGRSGWPAEVDTLSNK